MDYVSGHAFGWMLTLEAQGIIVFDELVVRVRVVQPEVTLLHFRTGPSQRDQQIDILTARNHRHIDVHDLMFSENYALIYNHKIQ